jgi:hypothetical protein
MTCGNFPSCVECGFLAEENSAIHGGSVTNGDTEKRFRCGVSLP